MREITIKVLNKNDIDELLEFENRNRTFFEKTCLSRGDSYYEYANFKSIVSELVDEQNEGDNKGFSRRNCRKSKFS
ncbi:Uncharacterised protein [Clostridium tertium]|uniref:N-acetyltransferase domain-containing protein n=1 Tax=Clostridium tertium TaxID=1559 RepID=A0A6N3EXF7_9CLOT